MAEKINFNAKRSLEDICDSAKDSFLKEYNNDNNLNIVVPGGNTPKLFFNYLSELKIDWHNVTLILSDERLVSVRDKKSNYGMIKKHLLDKLSLENRPTIIPNMEKYKRSECSLFLDEINDIMKNIAPIKMAFLGLGDDGHTASLFTGYQKESKNEQPFFTINRLNESFKRITLSMTFLSNISNIIFMVSGQSKENALFFLSKYKNEDVQIPAGSLVLKSKEVVNVFYDAVVENKDINNFN